MLNLTPATVNDAKFVFNLRNQEDIRAVSASSDLIDWQTHQSWFNNNCQFVSIIKLVNKDIGVLVVKNEYISIYFDKPYRGKGYGTKIINSLNQNLKAVIKPDNIPSIALFKKCGFVYDGKEYIKKGKRGNLICSVRRKNHLE